MDAGLGAPEDEVSRVMLPEDEWERGGSAGAWKRLPLQKGRGNGRGKGRGG